jgi:Glyoxalase-like domain
VHRSRLSTLVVDVPAHLAGRATDFWAAALGAEVEELPDEPGFTGLRDAVPQLVTAVQAVDDAPRLHVDLETDDVPAEVARLVALGAEQVAEGRTWVVLRDPSGLLLDVVPAESPGFDEHAREVG